MHLLYIVSAQLSNLDKLTPQCSDKHVIPDFCHFRSFFFSSSVTQKSRYIVGNCLAIYQVFQKCCVMISTLLLATYCYSIALCVTPGFSTSILTSHYLSLSSPYWTPNINPSIPHSVFCRIIRLCRGMCESGCMSSL